MTKIPLTSIAHGNQLRIGPNAEIDAMEASLSRNGQLCEILVRERPSGSGKYEVVFGNRRLEAARKLGWETIEAKVLKSASDSESIILALSENLDRKDLCDYEKALVFEKLHFTTGRSYADLAKLFGKSPAFISLHLAMLNLFPSDIASVEERTKVMCALSERHARILSSIPDEAERWNTAKLVVNANLGVRELEKICSRSGVRKRKGSKPNDIERIREVIESIIFGFDCKDVRPHSSLISPDHFTMFSSFPPFYKMNGAAAIEHFCALLNRIKELDTRINDLEIRRSGDFAYVTFIESHELVVDEKRVKNELRATIILQKASDWKIVHEHWSSANPMEHFTAFAPEIHSQRAFLKA